MGITLNFKCVRPDDTGQLQDALKQGDTAVLRLVTLHGGVAALDPGGSGSVTVNLRDGQYVLLCFVPSADGVPHLAKGMLKPLLVVKATASTTERAAGPKADVTINLMDFHFTMPAEVKAGQQVWKIVNDGPQPHEISLMRLAEGKTTQDAFAWFATPKGPPPFQSIGGMQGLTKGTPAAFLNLDLEPGNYAAVCLIPDPATGKPHAELGMVMPFTVK